MTKNIVITKKVSGPDSKLDVTVTGRLELEKVNYSDGWNITVPCCEIYMNVEVKGHGSMGGEVTKLSPAQAKRMNVPADRTWVVGKLALTDEQAESINSVRRELEAHPAWQAKQAQIAENERQDAEQRKQRESSAGWCKRCQDWTWGDCGHN